MTLSRHTLLLKLGIGCAASALAGLVVLTGAMLPFYPALTAEAVQRAGPAFLAHFGEPSAYMGYITMIASVCYALMAQILLFYLFEKTQSVEAHFFMFFVFSFVFEAFRAALPLRLALDLPPVYISLAAHALVFCRYFGAFSLFCASLYAAGFKTEREENLIFPLIVITLFVAFRLPVNTFTWDTSLSVVNGYPQAFRTLEVGIVLLTVLSFCCAAFRNGIKEYYLIGAGTLFVLVGRTLLLGSDTLIPLALGAALLLAGTWLFCFNLRRIYLWV